VDARRETRGREMHGTSVQPTGSRRTTRPFGVPTGDRSRRRTAHAPSVSANRSSPPFIGVGTGGGERSPIETFCAHRSSQKGQTRSHYVPEHIDEKSGMTAVRREQDTSHNRTLI